MAEVGDKANEAYKWIYFSFNKCTSKIQTKQRIVNYVSCFIPKLENLHSNFDWPLEYLIPQWSIVNSKHGK